MDFFNERRLSTLRTTPLLSFKADAPNKGILEADIAMLWQQSVFGEQIDGLIFGECKTYGEFEQKDYDRMRHLAKTFPGAIVVFSTIKRTLSAQEKTEIKRIAKTGRKPWKADRPTNPVLVLTGTELLNWHSPPYCWDETLRKKFDVNGLLQLCDATQQIHLGLQSWQTEWHAKWERKRLRRVAKIERHAEDGGS
jgi:hypothetical protein